MANIEIITLSQAVETIKTAILQSQARAARNVSANQLALYFSVGGYISLNTRQQQWGSGAIETISERLQKELPGLQGFSPTSIKNMRQFYETWCPNVFRQPLAGELKEYDDEPIIIRQPPASETTREKEIYLHISQKVVPYNEPRKLNKYFWGSLHKACFLF